MSKSKAQVDAALKSAVGNLARSIKEDEAIKCVKTILADLLNDKIIEEIRAIFDTFSLDEVVEAMLSIERVEKLKAEEKERAKLPPKHKRN